MNDNNFILYRASAGSGKTYTLVREFLTLCLSSSDVTFGNILAVTFTNKAANEMKAKILNYLKGIIIGDVNCEDMKRDLLDATGLTSTPDIFIDRALKLYNNIIHNYSDLNVSTIDTFVQQVSRAFSRELNLPNQYQLLLDSNEYLDEFIQQIDKTIGNDDGTLANTLAKYVKHKLMEEGKWRLDSSIKKFVEKLLKESAYKKGERLDAKSIDEQQYDEICKYLSEKVETYKNAINKTIDNIEEFNKIKNITFDKYNKVLVTFLKKIKSDINVSPKDLINTKTIKEILYGDKKCYEDTSKLSDADDRKLVDFFNEIVENHKKLYLINIIYKDIYLYILRGDLMEVLNEHIKETNKVHISEFNKRISDVIADSSVPFIYERIGAKYDHLFIDEFQDTSVLQWFNFLPLVSNSISNGNKTLLVGDAKQAIYRFRGGDVEQIIKLPEIHNAPKVKEDGTDKLAAPFDEYSSVIDCAFGEQELGTNHRSKKNVVVFNNSFFNYAKKYLSGSYKEVYEKSSPQKFKEKDGDYQGCVNVKIFDNEKDNDYKDYAKEMMLNDIRSLSNNNEDFKYSDIAILVRNKDDGTDIAEYLSKNNIPVISSDSVMLRTSNKIMLIIYTLKYMMDPMNKVNKFSVSYYKQICCKETADNCDSCDFTEVLKYDIDDKEIGNLRTSALSLYDLCMKIVRMYNFNILDDVFLQYFMNLVQNWQSADDEGINAFLEYWDRKSGDLFLEITGKINAVQILTIHKSKGLEYKIVMYPYAYTKLPGGKFHPSEKWLEFKDEKLKGLLDDMPHISNFILPISSSLEGTGMSSYYDEEIEKQAFDDFNLMYVAMTRAREILYIYTYYKKPKDPKKETTKNIFNEYFSNDDNCLNIENDEVLNVNFMEVTKCEDGEEVDKNYKEYQFGEIEYTPSDDKIDANEIKLTDDKLVPEFLDLSEYIYSQEEKTNLETEFTEKGKIIHELCSKIITFKDVEKVLRFYVNNGSIDKEESEKLLDKFKKITEDERVKDAYSEKAIIRNEMVILTEKGERRPDRYAELDDKVILIDYKTGKVDSKHNSQLKEYASIIKNQLGVSKPIEMYLVYLNEENEVHPV